MEKERERKERKKQGEFFRFFFSSAPPEEEKENEKNLSLKKLTQCSGVARSLSGALGDDPRASRSRAQSAWPLYALQWSGVLPSASLASKSARGEGGAEEG